MIFTGNRSFACPARNALRCHIDSAVLLSPANHTTPGPATRPGRAFSFPPAGAGVRHRRALHSFRLSPALDPFSLHFSHRGEDDTFLPGNPAWPMPDGRRNRRPNRNPVAFGPRSRKNHV